MRTNIVIDDRLMRQAARHTNLKTKKAIVESGLRLLVQIGRQEQIRKARGKLRWSGNLEKMRTDR